MSVHLAEHYLTPNRDHEVLALAALWSQPIEFTCYTGLDEPWLQPFRVEGVRDLIVRLGMDQTTALSHSVLRHDQRCASCEEWIQCNLPRRSA